MSFTFTTQLKIEYVELVVVDDPKNTLNAKPRMVVNAIRLGFYLYPSSERKHD